MKIVMKPYPNKEAPKDKWVLVIDWMSGDADHNKLVPYSFKKEEEFLKAYNCAQKILTFRRSYHNLMCDLEHTLCSNKKSSIEMMKDNSYYKPEVIEIVKEFLGTYKDLGEMIEDCIGGISYDVTCEGEMASIDSIDEMYYFDSNGNKFEIEKVSLDEDYKNES